MSGSTITIDGDALGAFEIATISRGIVVLDQMAKRARTTIAYARTLSPGRYLILLTGGVAEVEEAIDAARRVVEEDRVDDVIIRDPEPELCAALASRLTPSMGESLAIIETSTCSSTLLAADRALEGADVHLLELRLGAGLSGKGIFTLTGPLHMIEAAVELVRTNLAENRIIRIETIAQPHGDLPSMLLDAEAAIARGPVGAR